MNIIAEEYIILSSEIESTRLNNVRQTFERIANPTESDIRRLILLNLELENLGN